MMKTLNPERETTEETTAWEVFLAEKVGAGTENDLKYLWGKIIKARILARMTADQNFKYKRKISTGSTQEE